MFLTPSNKRPVDDRRSKKSYVKRIAPTLVMNRLI
jgi:hypothetical protein